MAAGKTAKKDARTGSARKGSRASSRSGPGRSGSEAAARSSADLFNVASGLAIVEVRLASGRLDHDTPLVVSAESRRLLGIPEHAHVTMHMLGERIDERDRAHARAALASHIADRTGSTTYDIEHRIGTGESSRWFRVRAATERDARGEPKRIVLAFRDIDQEKSAEATLQRAVTRFELISQASAIGLWDMSVVAGDPVNPQNVFWWSQTFRQMLGFTDEKDFPNLLDSWASRLHPRDKDVVLAAFAAHLNDRSGKTPYDIEYQLQLKSGEYRWYRATGTTLRDGDGVPLRVAGSLKDIHDEKETALSLQNAMSRFEIINQAAATGLWDMSVVAGDPVNPKNVFWWSQTFRQMLGFTDEKDFPNVLDSWASRLHAKEKDQVLAAFAAHLNDHSGKTPYDIEYRLQRKSGEYRWYRATGTTLRDEKGVPLRVAGSLKDIHDEKETVLSLETLIAGALEGDLTQRLSVDQYQGAMRSIGESMNRLLDSTADSFRSVRSAIEQVGQASGQLRATSQMMSQSSLVLNESVDRSSGELSRIADGVRANADNAAMANQLVTDTAAAARGGEQRMTEMSGAMAAINSSSQQIARIIKVIDEIAFQTNLLALNAAVEAARAGRHGKGFAVVAQEVRSLAERSAKAAKETAELIEDSSAKVDEGVKIADSTRGALRDIVANVTKVVDLAGEIAMASGEQSKALGSVSDSIRRATAAAQAGSQQSAEVASASEELSRQMDVLKGRMSKYKIASRPAAGSPAASGATPELIEHILNALRGRAFEAMGTASNDAAEPVFAELARTLGKTGTDDVEPRAVLPLDRDERGFKGF